MDKDQNKTFLWQRIVQNVTLTRSPAGPRSGYFQQCQRSFISYSSSTIILRSFSTSVLLQSGITPPKYCIFINWLQKTPQSCPFFCWGVVGLDFVDQVSGNFKAFFIIYQINHQYNLFGHQYPHLNYFPLPTTCVT
jgi:hypothetical protein